MLEVEHEGTVVRRHSDMTPPMYRIGSIAPAAKAGPEITVWWHDLHLLDAPDPVREMRFRPGDRVKLIVAGRLREGVVLRTEADHYAIHRIDPPDALGVPIRATDEELAPA
jgi:hypothetical protein